MIRAVSNITFSIKYSKIAVYVLSIAFCIGPLISLLQSFSLNRIIYELSIGQATNALFCLLLIVTIPLTTNTLSIKANLFIPIICFIYWISITIFYSISSTDTIVYCFRVFYLLMIYLTTRILSYLNLIDEAWFFRIGKILLAIIIISQIYVYYSGGARTNLLDPRIAIAGTTFQTSRWGAYLVSIFPIFFLKKKLDGVDYFFIFLALISSIFTFRRSATISLLFVMAFYALQRNNLKIIKSKIKTIFIFIIIFIGAYYITVKTPFADGFLLKLSDLNLGSGGTGSGRAIFWRITLYHLNEMSVIRLLIGDGVGALAKEMITNYGGAIGAHNDWLDILISFGFIGLTFFSWIFLQICLIAFSLYQKKDMFSFASLAISISFLVISITTGGILEPTFACLFGVLGFCAGKELQYSDKC